MRRLVEAYNQSAATLNLLRGFSTGGYAGLQRVTQWNLEFMGKSDEGQVGFEKTERECCLDGCVLSTHFLWRVSRGWIVPSLCDESMKWNCC